jgi:succinate-semialdehyde dehydrogenase / glutarate-semialdehyde dehydrogenase
MTALIAGTWRDPDSRTAFPVVNPATGKPAGEIWYADAASASEAAREAADGAAGAAAEWAAVPARVRADALLATSAGLAEAADRLGAVLCAESGKRLPEAVAEIRFAAEYFRWFAEQARRPSGEVLSGDPPGKRQVVVHRPAGVVACLTPWNFPVSIQARKLAAALAAGCTTVSRPSEKAPLAVVEMFRILAPALPPGVVNLVHGPAREVTEALLDHPAVRVVTFTGSTEVGRQIMARAARRIVRPALELGGDAPFIVFGDADIDAAVTGAMLAKFRNNGQSCIAANRFFVHDDVYDEFTGRFAAAVDAMRIGDPAADPVPDLGPLIDAERVSAVTVLVDEAVKLGARRLTRDFGPDVPALGSYAAPVLLADVPAVTRFSCEEAVLGAANDTEMGLAAYLYTRDLARADRVASRLEAGITGINDPLPPGVFAPMGGVKQSGLGREGGREGLEEFQNVHYVSAAL